MKDIFIMFYKINIYKKRFDNVDLCYNLCYSFVLLINMFKIYMMILENGYFINFYFEIVFNGVRIEFI